MASIRLEGICKRYGAVAAVTDLSLTCADGELLALLGPSGCGKTSTLKMIAGIEDVSAGEIYFGDRPVTALDAAERNVAMVFEDYALYPHLTVAQNVAFPLEIRHRSRDDIRRAVDDVHHIRGLVGDQDKVGRRGRPAAAGENGSEQERKVSRHGCATFCSRQGSGQS